MNLCKPLVHTHVSFGRVSYPSVHRLLQCTLAVFPAGAPLPALPLANSSSACAVRALSNSLLHAGGNNPGGKAETRLWHKRAFRSAEDAASDIFCSSGALRSPENAQNA
ncbi:hypothetical protein METBISCDRAFT_28099 [Metschnikowia bicuspidata]|uniref:Uncharacterized protein n=1 Tax=Metschnikowia bicuspidata TaxID=27322 RepID=A0A4P9ZA51_9ASCO|nr:hypothetical protein METBISCDRAFT_28099 [Metschnikowia bicuspidata]